MKKYIYFLLILAVISCSPNTEQKKVKESFNQLINSLKVEDSQKIDTLVPFLKNTREGERNVFLTPFRELINTNYKLDITKKSDNLYYIKVIVKDSNTIWSGIILPYQLNEEEEWVMAPIIKVIQTYDIVPAKN